MVENRKENKGQKKLPIFTNEWLKPIITSTSLLFLFLVFHTKIMCLFDRLIIPILSAVNEGVLSSIVFILLFLKLLIFWYDRFRLRYYVNPLHILIILLLCIIYWYYRAFTVDYTVIVSDLFHIGFSDIIFGALSAWSIIFIIIDLNRKRCTNKTNSVEEQTEYPPFILEEDKPITRRKDDELGFGADVDILFQYISNRHDFSSFSIGINARWGDGKSSFINLLEEKFLQYDDSFLVIRFNPRYSNNNTIQSAFFESFFSKLSKYDSRFKKTFNDYLKVIDVMAENKFLSALIQTTKLYNRFEEKDKINNAIMRLKKRVIVIIEDLDRLMKDEIIEVFKLIDENASFNNLVFISAYDKNRICSLMKLEDEKYSYSDKFFTWERTLPLRSFDLLIQYLIKHLIENLNLTNEEEDEIKNTIRANASFFKLYLYNLRDVKRYINIVKPSLKRIYKEIKIRDYLLIELVRYRYPMEYRTLYEQNSQNETNFERIITIEGIDNYKSKDILKVLFPEDGNSSYRSINSTAGFSIYFHEHLFEHLSIQRSSLMFEIEHDYKAIIKEILDKKKWDELNEYLDSINALSLQSWDAVIRYLDIYIHLNAHYNETLISTIKVGLFLEKRIADELCERFNIPMDEYKSILSQRLIGAYPEYPYEISKLQLWSYKSNELRSELIFTEIELMDILKSLLRDVIKYQPGYTALHNNILRACIASIGTINKKVTLDKDACEIILHAIKNKPDEYIRDFVFLGIVSSSPDQNNITCDPFWRQIFMTADNIKKFIFNDKLNNLTNIERTRNFWCIFEMNGYEAIAFENQGPVQAKIDANLEYERDQLNEILLIESTINSLNITVDTISSSYNELMNARDKLKTNTLYIKKKRDVMGLIEVRLNELNDLKNQYQ